MNETIQLIIFETPSLPKGYKALEEMSELGLEPLEFYPHAQGVRILFRAPQDFKKNIPAQAVSLNVTMPILKAILSQTGNTLKKHLVVAETKRYEDLIKLAMNFEKIGAEILELRSLRSNPEKNYALFTLDDKDSGAKLLISTEHAFLSASSTALKEFLGFL
jgi:hypothetical protein